MKNILKVILSSQCDYFLFGKNQLIWRGAKLCVNELAAVSSGNQTEINTAAGVARARKTLVTGLAEAQEQKVLSSHGVTPAKIY